MSSASHFRILDASLNRAGEGLRVVEDYLRFACDDRLLTQEIKALRHELRQIATYVDDSDRHTARETLRDVGTTFSTAAELDRDDAWSVCEANLKRAEQSLRSLEEYGKLVSTEFSQCAERLRYRLYTLEKAIDVGRSSRERLTGVTLCVLVDAHESAQAFERLVRGLVDAGAGMLQLRDKRLDDRDLVARARLLRDITRGTTTLAIINDRADIAAVVGADGVHLGQEDLSVKDARDVVGTRMLIGVSTHNIRQARQAVLDGANYLGAGPTFPSQTKSFDTFAGLDYLKQIGAKISLPTFAIGGITAKNLCEVQAAGIARIAVGSAVTDSPDPTVAARELLSKLSTTDT